MRKKMLSPTKILLLELPKVVNSDFSSSISSDILDKLISNSPIVSETPKIDMDKNFVILQQLWSANSSSSKSNNEIPIKSPEEILESFDQTPIKKTEEFLQSIDRMSIQAKEDTIDQIKPNCKNIKIKKNSPKIQKTSKESNNTKRLKAIKNSQLSSDSLNIVIEQTLNLYKKKYQSIEGINGEIGLHYIMNTKYLYVDTTKGNVYIQIPIHTEEQKNLEENKKQQLYDSWIIKDITKSMVGKAHYHTYLSTKLAFENHSKRKQNYNIGMHNGECIKIRIVPNIEKEKMFIIESQYIPDYRCCNKIKKYY